MPLVLHDYELDADAYKARLLLALLGVAWTAVPVDVFPGREHRGDAFLAMNPFGTLPVLVDGAVVVRGPEAVLVHIAERHDRSGRWLPADPAARADCLGWLAFSARTLAAADAARLEAMLGVESPFADAQAQARAGFRILEARLVRQAFDGHGFLVGPEPTIADLACFPPVVLAIDFQEALEDYPKLRAWTRRIRALPGFRAMPGIPEFL